MRGIWYAIDDEPRGLILRGFVVMVRNHERIEEGISELEKLILENAIKNY